MQKIQYRECGQCRCNVGRWHGYLQTVQDASADETFPSSQTWRFCPSEHEHGHDAEHRVSDSQHLSGPCSIPYQWSRSRSSHPSHVNVLDGRFHQQPLSWYELQSLRYQSHGLHVLSWRRLKPRLQCGRLRLRRQMAMAQCVSKQFQFDAQFGNERTKAHRLDSALLVANCQASLQT